MDTTPKQDVDTFDIDVRTRRPVKNKKPFTDGVKSKEDPKLEQAKALFRELIKHKVYEHIKGLAYSLCTAIVIPQNRDQEIAWRHAAISRSYLDMLFDRIEEYGKDIPPEEKPVINKTRVSFFAEN